mmetsp:Transcript_33808/g.111825  ORF Transcript_33808/g.111825 Transcript_33808/m.111825 type:complete len:291 (-) Transcript_33808:233-1105(-)
MLRGRRSRPSPPPAWLAKATSSRTRRALPARSAPQRRACSAQRESEERREDLLARGAEAAAAPTRWAARTGRRLPWSHGPWAERLALSAGSVRRPAHLERVCDALPPQRAPAVLLSLEARRSAAGGEPPSPGRHDHDARDEPRAGDGASDRGGGGPERVSRGEGGEDRREGCEHSDVPHQDDAHKGRLVARAPPAGDAAPEDAAMVVELTHAPVARPAVMVRRAVVRSSPDEASDAEGVAALDDVVERRRILPRADPRLYRGRQREAGRLGPPHHARVAVVQDGKAAERE